MMKVATHFTHCASDADKMFCLILGNPRNNKNYFIFGCE